MDFLNRIKESIFEILLPRFCISCGKEGRYICNDCEIFLNELPPLKEGVFSVWEYEGLMKKIVDEIKFKGNYHLIDELVEKALEKVELRLPENMVITYVPRFKKREKERGFNQAKTIAEKLSLTLNVENRHLKVLPFLEQIKDNFFQEKLDPQERLENVKGVFILNKRMSVFLTNNVLLVDDVYITGSTTSECVKVLKKSGVKNVWVFTLARKTSF